MVGLVTKTLKDGSGGTFTGYFYDDGTALFQASVQWDVGSSALVGWTAASPIKGSIASGSAASDAPFVSGGKAATALPSAATAGNVAYALVDKYGRQVVRSSLRENLGSQTTAITSSTSETTIVTADASNMLDIFRMTIANTSATDCNVTIKDGTAGTTRWVFAVKAGATIGFSGPVDAATRQAAVNSNWTATCSASVAAINVTVDYVKAGS